MLSSSIYEEKDYFLQLVFFIDEQLQYCYESSS